MSYATRMSTRASKDVHNRAIRPATEIAYTCVGLIVTALASVFVAMEIAGTIGHAPGRIVEQVLFGTILAGLIYGNLVYQITRIGYMRRLQRHRLTPEPDLSGCFGSEAARLTILVPSYKEEIRVLRQSLTSSALQRYPRKRVVLLIDNPPDPRCPEDRVALEATRALAADIQQRLDACADVIAGAAAAMRRRIAAGVDLHRERVELARLHAWVSAWFETQAAAHPRFDHSDELFLEVTYRGPQSFYRRRSRALLKGKPISLAMIEREYLHLEGVFRVEMTHFERKSFVNLSHEPNKAMNLNSYIGLVGGAYVVCDGPQGRSLERAPHEAADLVVPDADYLITLDADSILYPDYAVRLIHVMEEPGNDRLAVVQTPYSAVPGAPGLLERTAGATTDIQYNVHQGFANHGGTYWVGANALLRVEALRDICTTSRVGEHEIKRYISDRTVIEDTESSVDLLVKGWQLYSFPERLSFSATPADFGALLVQRRRWSNGGLIILPKLLRYLCSRRNLLAKAGEGFFRVHYLVSPTLVNVGVPILLIYPFEQNLRSPWLPLTALPYFFFYGRDLIQIGYRPLDLLRVYSLNLMLIPVNLGGILQSVRQIATGITIAFERTPKVASRTVAPRRYIVIICAFAAYALLGATFDIFQRLWLHSLFSAVNGAFILYAIIRFLRNAPSTAASPVTDARATPLPPLPASVAESAYAVAPGRGLQTVLETTDA